MRYRRFCQELGAQEYVVKPAISASGFRTTVFGKGHALIENGQHVLDEPVRSRDALVQPFLREVYDPGERSLIFFSGQFSHAVRRPPLSSGAASGENRERRITPSDDELALGRGPLARLPEMPRYARVDLIPLNAGRIALAELELIEPALYFSHCESSAGALIDSIPEEVSVWK